MSQKIDYGIPYAKITDEKEITYPWQQWADRVSKMSQVLQEAAQLMDDLDTGTATTVEIATAWNELRVKLQELV